MATALPTSTVLVPSVPLISTPVVWLTIVVMSKSTVLPLVVASMSMPVAAPLISTGVWKRTWLLSVLLTTMPALVLGALLMSTIPEAVMVEPLLMLLMLIAVAALVVVIGPSVTVLLLVVSTFTAWVAEPVLLTVRPERSMVPLALETLTPAPPAVWVKAPLMVALPVCPRIAMPVAVVLEPIVR